MPDDLPLTVLVRTRSRVATPLLRLLDALGIATDAAAAAANRTICICDAADATAADADEPVGDACVRLAASEDGFARARRTVGARNPSLEHEGRGLMPPAGHIATVTAEVVASAALLQALALADGERPAPARVDVEQVALHIIMPVISALSAGVKRAPVPPPNPTVYPLGIVPCADGEVGAYQAVPTEWTRFCTLIGREDIVDDFPTVAVRREQGAAIWRAAEPWFRAHTAEEVVRLAQEAALPYAPVQPLDELPHSPYLQRRGALATQPDGTLAPGTPFRVEHAASDAPPHAARAAVRDALFDALPPPASGPLAGLLVVEVTQHWAGPLTARLLADYGAHVIKCEPIGGDFWRVNGNLGDGDSWTFEPINLGKASIVVDLHDDADRALLRTLIAACDIRVENLSQGARQRAGLDFAPLTALNPDIIASSLPGYATDGPLAALRGMGWSFEVASGYASALGGAKAANSGYPYGDPIGAITAFLAVLRELARRRLSSATGATLLDIGQVAALSYTLIETLRTNERGPALTTLDDALAEGHPEPSWPLERITTATGRPLDHAAPLIALAPEPSRHRAPALDEHADALRDAIARAAAG